MEPQLAGPAARSRSQAERVLRNSRLGRPGEVASVQPRVSRAASPPTMAPPSKGTMLRREIHTSQSRQHPPPVPIGEVGDAGEGEQAGEQRGQEDRDDRGPDGSRLQASDEAGEQRAEHREPEQEQREPTHPVHGRDQTAAPLSRRDRVRSGVVDRSPGGAVQLDDRGRLLAQHASRGADAARSRYAQLSAKTGPSSKPAAVAFSFAAPQTSSRTPLPGSRPQTHGAGLARGDQQVRVVSPPS